MSNTFSRLHNIYVATSSMAGISEEPPSDKIFSILVTPLPLIPQGIMFEVSRKKKIDQD
jgi:hypothetical protein